MRKWFLLTLLLLAGSTACLYLFIPSKLELFCTKGIAVNANGFSRTFTDATTWKQWWPGKVTALDNSHFGKYHYNGYTFTISDIKLTSLIIAIENEKDSFTTELNFLPISTDSVGLSWYGHTSSGLSPFSRISQLNHIKTLEKDIEVILQKIKSFYAEEKNIYGLSFIKDFVVDSTLIATSRIVNQYPTVEQIYELIDQLKAFAQRKGARQTGLPMLHITTDDSLTYLTKVALPVDKKLKDEGNIVYRWMLGGGNILMSEVKGGPHTINSAFDKLAKYVDDHNRIAPAIPFQSLVTDRRQVRDTSQWITKLYWPVM